MTPPQHTALVLSGGGAYGAFAIGVMKALFAGRSPATGYRPLAAAIFSGTSVGSFNSSIMVSHPEENSLATAFRLEQLWLDRVAQRDGQCENGIFRLRGNPLDFLEASCLSNPAKLMSRFATDSAVIAGYFLSHTANFLASSSPLDNRLIQFVNVGSFIDSSPFFDLMHEVIDEEAIRRSPQRITVSTTNWTTGAVVHFTNADFHDDLGIHAVMASNSLPGIFPPVRLGQDLFVDGGVVENTPLNPAIESGATDLHVVYLNPQPRFIRLSAEPNTAETILRIYELMLATKIEEDIESARWINAGIRAVRGLDGDAQSTRMRDVVRSLGVLQEHQGTPYRELTIHRYFPESALGGSLGMLDFRADKVIRIIEEGETVALLHDCDKNQCVIASPQAQR